MLSPNLDENLKMPLYIQLYNYIKNEIKNKNLKYKDMLPSKRNLSSHLDISINTITKSYEILVDEGYIYSLERVGYFVSDIDNLIDVENSKNKIVLKEEKTYYKYNFKINNIDYENFPKYTFRKLSSEIINNNDNWLIKRDPQGLKELRDNIKNYLRQSRGVNTKSENIIISSGTEYLLQILLYILPKDTVYALENPGYKRLYDLFNINNVNYNLINIDSSGFKFSELINTKSNAILITPSHQFPTGNIMPISRRINLLNWANENKNNYIIEDDYDSEFKYYGKPIPALKSLDNLDKVIYIGNFSKSVSASLRLSYMVLPNSLLEKFYSVMPFINCPVSSLIQLTMAKFIEDGYFERHVNRMRNIYKKKRNLAISQFKNEKNFKVIDKKAGLHFIVEINKDISEREIEKALKIENIYLEGLSKYYIKDNTYKFPKIIIGFGNLSEDEIVKGISVIIKTINNM